MSIEYDINKTFEQNLIMNGIDPVEIAMFHISGMKYYSDRQKAGKPFTFSAIMRAICLGAIGITVHASILGVTYMVSSSMLCSSGDWALAAVLDNFWHTDMLRCEGNEVLFQDMMSLARSIGTSISSLALGWAGHIVLSQEQVEQATRVVTSMQQLQQQHPNVFINRPGNRGPPPPSGNGGPPSGNWGQPPPPGDSNQRAGRYRSKVAIKKNKKQVSNNKKIYGKKSLYYI